MPNEFINVEINEEYMSILKPNYTRGNNAS